MKKLGWKNRKKKIGWKNADYKKRIDKKGVEKNELIKPDEKKQVDKRVKLSKKPN